LPPSKRKSDSQRAIAKCILLTNSAGPFLTTTTPTTYRTLLSPYTAHLRHTIPSLLFLNRQIHAEASKILYATYTFSFHTSIEAAVPFFSDLTPTSRAHVRHITLTKKALPYTKEFDRAEWANLCDYLASPNMALRTCMLQVIAGRPDTGFEDVRPIGPAEFESLLRMKREWKIEAGGVDLEWIEQFMKIGGLREVSVRALEERCARPVSEKLAFWVAFSRSVVEGGFGEWVTSEMVGEGRV
jgi:hypothetical protein